MLLLLLLMFLSNSDVSDSFMETLDQRNIVLYNCALKHDNRTLEQFEV